MVCRLFIILLSLIYLTNMRLLMITRRLDKNDSIAGFTYDWVCVLSQMVDKLVIICLYQGNIDGLPDNINIFSLGKERHLNKPHFIRRIISLFLFYKYLWQLRDEYDCVFVHMHTIYVILAGWLWRITGRKIGLWYAHVRVSWMAKISSYFVNYIFSPSIESFNFPTDKLIETGHGINTEVFKPADFKKKSIKRQIVSVSRITQVKDYITLIETIKILVEQYSFYNFEIKIIGKPTRKDDNKYLKKLRQKIIDYKLSNYFKFIGSVANRDVSCFYQQADIFVGMQKGGGFDKAVLEAMSCGVVCVLCSPVYKNILKEYNQDTLFKEADPKDMAKRLYVVLHWNDDKFNEYKKMSRAYVKNNHNLYKLMDKIVLTYKRI